MAQCGSDPLSHVWQSRRDLLANVMRKAGFVRHPHEWWHFSYGDQLWAWKKNISTAIYGSCTPSESKERTAASPNRLT